MDIAKVIITGERKPVDMRIVVTKLKLEGRVQRFLAEFRRRGNSRNPDGVYKDFVWSQQQQHRVKPNC